MKTYRFKCLLSAIAIACMIAGTSGIAQAQFGPIAPAGPGPFRGPIAPFGSPNTVDLDLRAIIDCANDADELPDEIAAVCATPLLPALIDELVQAEEFIDDLITGYRNDMPGFFRLQLQEPLVINVVLVVDDGPGGTLATAGPDDVANFLPNPFLRLRGGFRAWSLPRTATMNLDAEDVLGLIVTGGMVDTIVHETFHAMGHPFNFDQAALSDVVNAAGQINFIGDVAGINGRGFGLTEYRVESGNPFAQFIPLQQFGNTGPTPGHLSPNDPTFDRADENLQEVFIPTAPPPGVEAFMSRALQGMFADLGYVITGINGEGFMDVDLDGIEDDPLIIDPDLPTDGDP